jgi:hypothetical protein
MVIFVRISVDELEERRGATAATPDLDEAALESRLRPRRADAL